MTIPNTHLELTMIHEVMVLDHSGPALGMIIYAAAVKLFVFASLIINLVLPFSTGSSVIDWVVFLAGTLAVAVLGGHHRVGDGETENGRNSQSC